MRPARIIVLLLWCAYGLLFVHGIRRGYEAAEYRDIKPWVGLDGYDPRILFEAVAGGPSPPGPAPR